MGIASPHQKLFFGSNAEQGVYRRLHPPERLRTAEHQEDQQAPIAKACIWLVAPSVGRALKGAVHGVVPQRATRNSPKTTVTVLNMADRMNRNSEAFRMTQPHCLGSEAWRVLQAPPRLADVYQPAHYGRNSLIFL